MNSTETPQFTDEVYELALPSIKELYGDMSVEELKGLSFEHMPTEVRNALQIAYSKLNQEEKIIPIGKMTLSEDGKTCSECSSELVLKKSTVSDSAGIRENKFLGCPKGCNSLTKRMNQSKIDTEKLLEDGAKSIEGVTNLFVLPTRNIPEKSARKIMKINLDSGFRCSPPNSQMTELSFALETTFETKEKIVKKTGKIIEFRTCEHGLEEYIEKVNASGIYKVLKVEKIGKLCKLSEYSKSDQCFECRKIGGQIEYELRKHDFYYDTQGTHDDRVEDIRLKFGKDVVDYRITIQRIDAKIPEIIMKVLNNRRFNEHRYDFLPAYEVTKLVAGELYKYQVPDSLKSKVTSQLKALYNKNHLEIKVEEHHYSNHRYDKVSNWQSPTDAVPRWFKNEDYVGDATTLNYYRASDHSAIYLTPFILNEIKQLRELRKSPNTTFHFRDNGSEEGRIWNFDEAIYLNEIWHVIKTNMSSDPDASVIFNSRYGLVWNACLSGIKRKRERR
ncbi:MAG: hypothetical protein K5790_10525 [Nitrosopumilus sp.]|uniref:hypothetical protein n=1 Tax=Nitrosopumilus sp. TaxID=2024843 RepID=UPI00247B5A3A|nr:hypothetical protein [Nitrosopumilus sp.]MCV0393705.1 hypothetical protein [Nitrosopumilus sp.]